MKTLTGLSVERAAAELVDWRWDLQTLVQHGTLTLETNVSRPAHETGEITLRLHILTDTEVLRTSLDQRIVLFGQQRLFTSDAFLLFFALGLGDHFFADDTLSNRIKNMWQSVADDKWDEDDRMVVADKMKLNTWLEMKKSERFVFMLSECSIRWWWWRKERVSEWNNEYVMIFKKKSKKKKTIKIN